MIEERWPRVEGGRFEIYCRATTAGSNPALSAISNRPHFFGEMTEWTKVLAWNASVGQPTVGSNPTLSAICAIVRGPRWWSGLVVGDP